MKAKLNSEVVIEILWIRSLLLLLDHSDPGKDNAQWEITKSWEWSNIWAVET